MAEPEKKSAAIAAAIILIGFGVLAYFLPPIMLAIGAHSQIVAAIFAVLFVVGFFGVFWLRARCQKRD